MKTMEYKVTATTDFMSAHETWRHIEVRLSDQEWYVRSYVSIAVAEGEAPQFNLMLVTTKEIDMATVYERLNTL